MVAAAALVSRAGCDVVVSAPGDALDELTRLGAPFLELTPLDRPYDPVLDPPFDAGTAAQPVPGVAVVPAPPDGVGWRRVVSVSDYEPDRVLWVHDARRAIALVAEPGAWRDQQLLRCVRHVLRWQAHAAGQVFLHGGLVRHAGRGIVVTGGKRAGKTSTILSALLHGRGDFVSNDDVTITAGDGAPVGHGWPRTLTVRTDVLLALAERSPNVRDLLSTAGHPTNHYPGRHRGAESFTARDGSTLPGSVWVRCAELAALFGCRVVADARVDAIVFPRFDDRAGSGRIARLDAPRARTALLANLENEATKYDPFLRGWFAQPDVAARARVVEHLAASVPCFELVQDLAGLSASTALMTAAVA